MQDGSLLQLVKVTKWWTDCLQGRTGTALEEHQGWAAKERGHVTLNSVIHPEI
jgi:hypothetical protein